MKDQRARGILVQVVAAKAPGRWIVRGIRCFATVEEVQAEVLNFIGRLNLNEVEWTTHEYAIPHYIAYPSPDLKGLEGWPTGVYIHQWVCDDSYGDAKRLDVKATA